MRDARPSPGPCLASSRLLSWGGRSRSGMSVLPCDLVCMPPRPPLGRRTGRGCVSFRATFGARPRGFHLITDEVVQALPDLPSMRIGLLHWGCHC